MLLREECSRHSSCYPLCRPSRHSSFGRHRKRRLRSAVPAKPAQLFWSASQATPQIRYADKTGTALLVGIASDASMLRLDCRADVDGGQSGEDERLNPDDDDDLEHVEQCRGKENEQENPGLEDEDEAEEGQDQDVAREHVGEKTDTQR